MKHGIVGLDLSLRSTGACFIPRGWKGDTRRLKVGTWGRESDGTPRDKAMRMLEIAESVARFVERHVPRRATVYVEEYAHAMAGQANAAALRELGGVVKARLLERLEVEVVAITASAARKILLQKVPQAKSKDFTELNVRRLGGEAVYWNGDQVDAFVIANAGVAMEGGSPLSFLGTSE